MTTQTNNILVTEPTNPRVAEPAEPLSARLLKKVITSIIALVSNNFVGRFRSRRPHLIKIQSRENQKLYK